MNPSMDATREKRRWTRTWDALVDADPVLAKELLVTARTPAFVGSMIVAPLVLGALVLCVRLGMRRIDPLAGRELFPVYFTGLSIALGLVGAALGSTVVVQEREAGALEALKFSALGPGRIVRGKFAAVVLAELAVVVCTMPLLGFVLAMGGVSLGETCVAMSIALACGVMTASLGVAVSAHAANTRQSLLLSLLGSAAVGIGVMIWLAAGSELGQRYHAFGVARGYLDVPWNGPSIAVLLVIPAYALTTVLWFGHAAATSGLMDLSEDRSLPIKRWTVGAYAMGAMALVACSAVAREYVRESIVGGSMIAVATLAAVLLFVFAGEPVRPTRRMQVHRPSLFVRAVYPWCLAPSIFFTIAASGVVLLSVPVLSGAPAKLELDGLWVVACLSALGGLLGCVAARRGATRARQLGAFALVGLTFCFLLLRAGSRGPTWVDGICPLGLDLEGGPPALRVLTYSLVAWGTASLLSLATMLRAVRAEADRRSRSLREIATAASTPSAA
jgi:ABC-type transport system involved in cytochrome c biogenesis permease component